LQHDEQDLEQKLARTNEEKEKAIEKLKQIQMETKTDQQRALDVCITSSKKVPLI
jgi:hypothetical protein